MNGTGKRRMITPGRHKHWELPGCAASGCVSVELGEASTVGNTVEQPAQAEQVCIYCGRAAMNGDTSFCEARRRATHGMQPICHHYGSRPISWEYRYEHDSVVEIASVNQNVAEYCKHWEERAENAERQLRTEREAWMPRFVWKQDALEPKCAGCGKPAWDNIHSGTGHVFWTTGSISSPSPDAAKYQEFVAGNEVIKRDLAGGTGEPPLSKLPEATDLEPLWTVCSNLESILLRSVQGDYPKSFHVNFTHRGPMARGAEGRAGDVQIVLRGTMFLK